MPEMVRPGLAVTARPSQTFGRAIPPLYPHGAWNRDATCALLSQQDGGWGMRHFVSPRHKQTWLRPARVAIVSVSAVIAAGDHVIAASGRSARAATNARPVVAVEALIGREA